MAEEFAHDSENNRYTMHVDGTLAGVVDYSVMGNTLAITRVFSSPPFRGKGIAGQITTYAVDEIEKTTDYNISAVCSYAVAWFEKHPERAGLFNRS